MLPHEGGRAAEGIQTVGIQHDRPIPAFEQSFDEAPIDGAEPGSDGQHVVAICRCEDRRNVVCHEPIARACSAAHHAGIHCGIDRLERSRADHGRGSGSRGEGRSGCEHRGAGDPRRTADHSDRSDRPLVGVPRANRSRGIDRFAEHQFGSRIAESDLDDEQIPHPFWSFAEQVAGFRRLEGDARVGVERGVLNGSSRSVESGGNVHGEYRDVESGPWNNDLRQ